MTKVIFNRRDMLKIMVVTLSAGLIGSAFHHIEEDGHWSFRTSSRLREKVNILTSLEKEAQSTGSANAYNVDRPNIILILSDNHNAQTTGCSGHPFIRTPGMDRLANEGVLFENTFSTTAHCSPSRASILTGAYATRHGVMNNHTPWTGQLPTFLEHLSWYGYTTAFIGKWHMHGKGLPDMPFLDLFISYTYREGQGSYFNCPMVVNGVETKSRKSYITEELTDYAIEFLRAHKIGSQVHKKPFCLYLAHKPGHPPFQRPEDIDGIYKDVEVREILPKHIDPWWYGKANRNIFQGVMIGSYYD